MTGLVPSALAEFLKMQGSDALLLSYPKSGRTWLRMALGLCLVEQYGLHVQDPTDLSGLASSNANVPVIRATHDGRPHLALPRDLRRRKYAYFGTRIIFLVRDPRDVSISLYYHHKYRDGRDVGGVDEWVRAGVGGLPTAVEFMNCWVRNLRLAKEVTLVRYEDMQVNLGAVLCQVCRFVGVEPREEYIVRVVEGSSFNRMHALEAEGVFEEERLSARDPSDVRTYKTRAGKVGGYVGEVDSETRQWMDTYVRDRLDASFGYR